VPVIEIIPVAGARANIASLVGAAQFVNDHVDMMVEAPGGITLQGR
jgi:hypothetical protein